VPLGYAVVGFFMGLGLLVLAVRSPGKQQASNVRSLNSGTGTAG